MMVCFFTIERQHQGTMSSDINTIESKRRVVGDMGIFAVWTWRGFSSYSEGTAAPTILFLAALN